MLNFPKKIRSLERFWLHFSIRLSNSSTPHSRHKISSLISSSTSNGYRWWKARMQRWPMPTLSTSIATLADGSNYNHVKNRRLKIADDENNTSSRSENRQVYYHFDILEFCFWNVRLADGHLLMSQWPNDLHFLMSELRWISRSWESAWFQFTSRFVPHVYINSHSLQVSELPLAVNYTDCTHQQPP